MFCRAFRPRPERRGASNPVVVVLLAAILLALIVLIAVLLTGRGQSTASLPATQAAAPSGMAVAQPPGASSAVSPGQQVERKELPKPPTSPKPIGDEKRIKEVAQAGKTYLVLVKGGLTARVEDKDWGVKQVVNLGYAFEASVSRKIESNDGKKVVEVRTFDKVRTVKLLSQVESVTIDLGAPGQLVLGALDEFVLPGVREAVLAAKPVAEAIMGAAAQAMTDDNSKALGQVDSLSGKKVRITYVDGVGVQSIEPIGCSLTASERDYVFATAVLSDYYTMPNLEIPVGGTWTVDGANLVGFFDPSMRGVTQGEIVIARNANQEEGGKHFATLAIQQGYLEINSSDASTRRVGKLSPRGTMRYNVSDAFVESARFTGDVQIEELSQNHLLFEASFKTRPKLEITYSCKIQ